MKYERLLFARFALVNAFGAALLGAAWSAGLVRPVMAGDRTGMVWLISGVFLVGLAWCARLVRRTSLELDAVRDPDAGTHAGEFLLFAADAPAASRLLLAGALKVKLASRAAPVRHIANSLVFLGLVGTVVGFVIALSGVDPDAASDPSAVGPMIGRLVDGMGTALHTTLVGSVLNIWLNVNARILEGGLARLWTKAVERAEAAA